MDKKEKRVRPRPKSKVTQRRLNKRRPQDPFKTARNQTKAEEPISPTKRKMLDKQKQDQMGKQSLTQDYAYTGIPGAIEKPAGVTIPASKKLKLALRGGGRAYGKNS